MPRCRHGTCTLILATVTLFLSWLYDECDGTRFPQADKLCPASSVNTYLDALRVCRGEEFNEVSACQDERISMRCPPSQYIVVYTAEWQTSIDHRGRPSCRPTSEGCSGQQAVDCILQAISLRCQGRRYCSLVGNEQDIHGPCLPEQPGRRLSVVYVCLSKLAQRDMTAGWRRINPCLSTTSASYVLMPSAAVPANISDMVDDDSQWFDEYQPIVTSSYVYSAGPPLSSDVSDAPIVVRTVDKEGKSTTTMMTSRTGPPLLPASIAVRLTTPAVTMISYDRDDIDDSVVSDWMSTGHYLIENANQGVTFLLLGAAVGVLGVLAVVIVRLCKLYGRPTTKTHQRLSSQTLPSSGRRCNDDQYSPVPSDTGDADGTACIMVPVTSPPSSQQTKRSCSQLPVHWVRSESDRDPAASNDGHLCNSMIVGHRERGHRLSATLSPTDSSVNDNHELEDIREEILSIAGSPSPMSSTAHPPAAATPPTTNSSVQFSDGYTRPSSSMNYQHSSSPSNAMLQSFSAGDVPPSTSSTERTVSRLSALDTAASCGSHQPGSETSSTTTLLGRYWWPPQTKNSIPSVEHHRSLSAETTGLTKTRSGDGSCDPRRAEAQSSPTSRLPNSSESRQRQHSPQVRVEVNGVVSYCRPSSSMSSGTPEEHQYSASAADSLRDQRDQRYATAPRRVNNNGASAAPTAARSTYYSNGTYQPFQTYATVGGKLLPTTSSNSFDQSDANGDVGLVLPVSAARQWHVTPDGYRVPPTATIHRTHGLPSRSFLQQTAVSEPLTQIVQPAGGKALNELEANGECALRELETLGTLSGNDPGCRHLMDCTRIGDGTGTGTGTGTENAKSTLQSYCI